MVECVVKGAPPCRAAPFVGLSWVPLLSVTRLSPFVRAVRSSPPFRHRGRTLFATAYADHAKHHSEDCAKRDDCLRIHRRHLLQRLPGVAKHLRQFQQNTLPKRGYYFAAATHRNARRYLARGALYRAAQIACAMTPFVSTLFQRSAILQFCARVAERQTRRSQKPISKGVWVRIPPRAPFFLGNPPTTEQNEHEAPRTAGFEHGTNVSRETFVHVFSCDGTKKAFRSSAGWKRKAFCLCSDVLGGVLYSVKSFSPLNTAMASSTE